MLLPIGKLGPQALEVNRWEGILGACEIAAGSIEDGLGADKVVARLMMKGDSQLNQSLQMSAPGASTRGGPPNVFKHFVGVEKMGLIEEVNPMFEATTIGNRPCRHKSITSPVFLEIYSFPYNRRCQ